MFDDAEKSFDLILNCEKTLFIIYGSGPNGSHYEWQKSALIPFLDKPLEQDLL